MGGLYRQLSYIIPSYALFLLLHRFFFPSPPPPSLKGRVYRIKKTLKCKCLDWRFDLSGKPQRRFLFMTFLFFSLFLSIEREASASSIACEKCIAHHPRRIPNCADVKNVVVYTHHRAKGRERKRNWIRTEKNINLGCIFLDVTLPPFLVDVLTQRIHDRFSFYLDMYKSRPRM